jgi:hypothetical protein
MLLPGQCYRQSKCSRRCSLPVSGALGTVSLGLALLQVLVLLRLLLLAEAAYEKGGRRLGTAILARSAVVGTGPEVLAVAVQLHDVADPADREAKCASWWWCFPCHGGER